MTLLAHNDDSGEEQALEEHLQNVADNSRKIVEEKELEFDEDISRFVEILGLCHDFGKANILFQDYLNGKDISDKKKQHSLISAYYTFTVLQEEGFSEKLQILGWLIILKHHGDLENLFGGKTGEIKKKIGTETKQILNFQIENLSGEAEELYQKLGIGYVPEFKEKVESEHVFKKLKEIYRNQARERFDKEPENFFLTLFCYSVLLDSDKMDTAGFDYEEWPSVGTESVKIPSDAVDNYKKAQGWDDPKSEINKIRQEAYQEAEKIIEGEEDLMTLTLPTGAGKTLTALNMALKMRLESDLERSPRIIYSLPFLSIIDQNYEVVQNVLENEGLLEEDKERPELLLRHDHLSPGYAENMSDEEREEEEEKNPGNPILLTEGWNSEIVNTTFVQFFETLFSTENSQARKFHKIANSIILLDEIQSLPIKYWKPVEEAFKVLAEKFNTKIILMTATQPELIEKEDSEEAIPEEKEEEYFKTFDRVDYEFDLELNDLEVLTDEVESEAETGKDLMVVMNTKSSAKQLYEALNDVDSRIIFLSTDILPKHREERIREIKESDEPVLVVTTQLIEAGVDIDMDIVWRDFAPLDSIVQTAGRCNREDSKDKGLVKVVKLEDEHGRAYCNYVYTGDSDSGLIGYTQEVIEDFSGRVSEAEFNRKAVKDYFSIVNERKNQDHEDVLKNIKELNFSDIDVSLIENIQSVPIFVHSEGSNQVYQQVNEIYDKPYFERRKEMQELKSEFHSFIVNARIYGDESKLSGLNSTEFSDNFKEIEKSKIGKTEDDWYHEVTGFQIPDSKVGDRIL
ncbi:MAG: CRISPR-associated helicase Cas3' [Candidatus Nanohaloarchaea archaeon]